ncbi:MAG: cardiolipin synthase [Verrucomicrobia bacterium]|nr:cardiolipin synthase [Kiritimatiellia bacterium]MCP5488491.1 cardiolipin synthase [Verrucomicrobiota bacterium]
MHAIPPLGIPFWTVLHLAGFSWVVLHCLRHRREPISTLLWMVAAWSLPILGFLLYLMFGITRVRRKTWKKESANQRLRAVRQEQESETLPLHYWRSLREAAVSRPEDPQSLRIDTALAQTNPDHVLLRGNHIQLLTTGDEAFPAMLEAIRSATNHIHLQCFIIGNDPVGRAFMDALAERAEAGVQVRVLFDRFGSTQAVLSGLFRRYRNIPGLHIQGWSMARLLKRQFQVNLRNHRKTLVVDGKTAFMGGINLQEKHRTRPFAPAIRDYHVRLRGPIVHELQYTFLSDWYYITEESPRELLKAAHFPTIEWTGHALIRLVNGSPATELDEICDALFSMITLAEKSILASTPYFIPSSDIIRALRIAALRGVDVRIIVPRNSNHFYAGLAGRALYEELLDAGVRIYERHPPFLHGKAMLIDDTVAMVGTANLDIRSLRLNYETNLAIYDPGFANQIKEVLLDEISHSEPIDLNAWRNRPERHKIIENLCHILTPML